VFSLNTCTTKQCDFSASQSAIRSVSQSVRCRVVSCQVLHGHGVSLVSVGAAVADSSPDAVRLRAGRATCWRVPRLHECDVSATAAGYSRLDGRRGVPRVWLARQAGDRRAGQPRHDRLQHRTLQPHATRIHPALPRSPTSASAAFVARLISLGPFYGAIAVPSITRCRCCCCCCRGHRFYIAILQVSLLSHAACAIAIAGFGSS